MKSYFKGFGVKIENKATAPVINIGTLTYDASAKIEISQQAIFGRHCAVVGTTGGGKSYTTSKLVEGIVKNKGKAILIDATGEYNAHDKKLYSAKPLILSTNSYFPYSRLTIGDLFVLFRPSGQVQQPILLEAIKSLKLAHCIVRDYNDKMTHAGNVGTLVVGGQNLVIEDGCIKKQGCETAPFKKAYLKYAQEIEDNSKSDFDIQKLVKQVLFECYYDNGATWSVNRDDRNFSNCTSLLMRINTLVNDDGFKNILGFQIQTGAKDVVSAIEDFLKDDTKSLLRIGFENVPFSFQSREILANSIGKFLLNQSRTGKFKAKPVVLFLDEAHQFLNKNVKDEYFESTELNSFDSIAKECRKYGLFLCISTQMPRDIPVGTLSQIGTFIVHRLINHFDKDSIANACSSANKSSLDFLPTLGAGEAILMGVDFPMPVTLKIDVPDTLPDSHTPQFTN